MLEVKNLTKRYGDKKAVDNISFTAQPGEILGFLGPNGAGKSTTMNIITGYLSSNEGTVNVGGFDILAEPVKAKSKIGYLPEHPPLYLDMTVREYLDFLFDLKKIKMPKKAHLDEIAEMTFISDVMERMIKNLSKGYRQRVGLAGALLGNPELIILDEPTVGLDPKQIIEIRSLIRSLAVRHTVILSSHILPEVQAVCDRVLVLNKGRIVADDTPDNLANALSSDRHIRVRVRGERPEVEELLRSLPGVKSVEFEGEHESGSYDFSLDSEDEFDLRGEMFFRLAEKGWPILSLRTSELSLEEIFLSLTGDTAAEQGMADSEEVRETGSGMDYYADSDTSAAPPADETEAGDFADEASQHASKNEERGEE